MINKVFFPATFITQAAAAALNHRLGRFVLYQPIMGQTPRMLEHLSETYAIELRHPVIGKEAFLLELCQAYSSWGNLHQKDALRLNRLAGGGFYNQDFAAEIKTEVLKNKKGVASEADKKVDPLANARMFLQLAQEFDRSESEIRENLEKADHASRQLFEQLRGEGLASGDFSASGGADDACAVMTESRLAAWSLLAKADTVPPDVFITDSRSVINAVTERFPSIIRMETTSASGDPDAAASELAGSFQSIADAPWTDAGKSAKRFSLLAPPAEDGFVLEAYGIPEISSAKVIESFTGFPESESFFGAGPRHAFFCLITKTV